MSRDGTSSGLADFLRSARARRSPQQAGIEASGAGYRRVSGLRREELARLAGVSVDYYTRLEQGRSRSASVEVLNALATALGLDDAERTHLHTLAQRPRLPRKRRPKPQQIHRATLDLLDVLDRACRPAFVLGRRLDVLAHNTIAKRLIIDFHAVRAIERNQARFVFLDPYARELYRDWVTVAADTAAMLRLDAGRHPDDPLLRSLIGDLSIRSAEFRHHWSANRVHQRTTGTKDYHHPVVGEVSVTYQALTLGDDPEQTLFVYSTARGSSSEAALQLLADGDRPAAEETTHRQPEFRRARWPIPGERLSQPTSRATERVLDRR